MQILLIQILLIQIPDSNSLISVTFKHSWQERKCTPSIVMLSLQLSKKGQSI